MRIVLLTLLILAATIAAFGQAARVDISLQTYGPNVPTSGGPLPQALWVANATAYLCTHPSATLAACQASLITTYTDITEGTTCPPTTQLVQLPGNTCTSSTGAAANIGAWVSNAIFDYWVANTYGSFGPFSYYPPGGGCTGSNTISTGCTGATTAAGALANLGGLPGISACGNNGYVGTEPGAMINAAIQAVYTASHNGGTVDASCLKNAQVFVTDPFTFLRTVNITGGASAFKLVLIGDPGATWEVPFTFAPPSQVTILGGGTGTSNGCGTNCGLTIQPTAAGYSGFTDNALVELGATSAFWTGTMPPEGVRLIGVNVNCALPNGTMPTYPFYGVLNQYAQNFSGATYIQASNCPSGIEKENAGTVGGSYNDGPWGPGQIQINAQANNWIGIGIGQLNTASPGATQGGDSWDHFIIQSGAVKQSSGTGAWSSTATYTATDVAMTPNTYTLTSAGGNLGASCVGCAVNNAYVPLGDYETAWSSANSITIGPLPISSTVSRTNQTVTIANAQITATASMFTAGSIGSEVIGTGLPAGTRIIPPYASGTVANISPIPSITEAAQAFSMVVEPTGMLVDGWGGNFTFNKFHFEGVRYGAVLGAATTAGGAKGVSIRDWNGQAVNISTANGLAPLYVDSAVVISSANPSKTFGIAIENMVFGGNAANEFLNQITGAVGQAITSNGTLPWYIYDQSNTGIQCELAADIPTLATITTPCLPSSITYLAANNVLTGHNYFDFTTTTFGPSSTPGSTNVSSPTTQWCAWGGALATPANACPTFQAQIGSGATPNITLNWTMPTNTGIAAYYMPWGTTSNPVVHQFYKSPRFYDTAGTYYATFSFAGTVSRITTLPDGPNSTVIPWDVSTSSGSSDAANGTQGITSASHCSMMATNATAAANIATTYAVPSTNTLTVYHTTLSGMTYTGVCTSN